MKIKLSKTKWNQIGRFAGWVNMDDFIAEKNKKEKQIARWTGGTWNDGIWENGIWENGIWKDGTWEFGTWEDGTWKDGWWRGGTWEKGIWENGGIFDPEKIGNFESTWKWDIGNYVNSPINPKEYFSKT